MADMLKFQAPKNQSSIIKVIGVGGGGGNAVNHMYRQGIKGVDFVICNTDAQAMESSPVPTRIQLGANLTSGLGAGAAPSVGRNAALENADDIRAVLSSGTKMLFITAGMGGGTGTGAAPVIAQISREMDILTVGIVTIPFSFEGRKRRLSADEGIKQLRQHVDALLIISNDKLRELCGDLPLSEAFKKADNVLTTAAKGIAEIITVVGYINVDFEDVKTVMRNSGVAIMGTGIANGPNRAKMAVEEALISPLLDNNDISGAGNILLYITSGKKEVTMDEVTEITDYIQDMTKATGDIIWGNGFEEGLEDNISVTIIATGFDEEHRQPGPAIPEEVKVFDLYNNEATPKIEKRILGQEPERPEPMINLRQEQTPAPAIPDPVPFVAQPVIETIEPVRNIEFSFEKPEPDSMPEPTATIADEVHEEEVIEPVAEPKIIFRAQPDPEPLQHETAEGDLQTRKAVERISKLRHLSEKLKNHQPIEQTLYELENVPAYKRRGVEIPDVPPSNESQRPDYTVSENSDKTVEIKKENTFLNKKVD